MKYIKTYESNEFGDYVEVDLYKLGIQLTYSTFNRQGDKEYKWRSEARKMIKNLFTDKVVTLEYNDLILTDLVENVSTYDDVDVPILMLKFSKLNNWKPISASKPFKIWNDDSETAKQVRLEIEAKKYNL